MTKCYLCGEDVTPGEDCERRFLGGAKAKYVCCRCARKGAAKVIERRINYFDLTYEGRKRIENRRHKNRE